MEGTTVIVLNADFSPLNVVKYRRAINLVLNKKAVVVEATKKMIVSAERTVKMLVPKVIRLVEYVNFLRKTVPVYSKKLVVIRDKFRCAYCGTKDVTLTIDHVVPKSRGGKTNFQNCVAACYECNNKKRDREPHEAGMKLLVKPYKPSVYDFIRWKMQNIAWSLTTE
ncbi:MAG TPA: HNH endonuclease [Cytophagales bacterium]|jgi:5-methylcytosine-specific restriction endonuclease McrA|nr:HNH endonuclease [Cytophagales bacterium]